MTRVTFHDDAEAELIEAARYYESRSPGLGAALVAEATQAASGLANCQEGNLLVLRTYVSIDPQDCGDCDGQIPGYSVQGALILSR
jgi:hypothetical protein